MTGMSFIARDVCGTIEVAMADDDRLKDAPEIIAEWLRAGMTVERVPTAWVRGHFMTTDRYVAEVDAS